MNAKRIALLGKGGVGKTMLSALIGRIFCDEGKRVLFVDADPARGLTGTLDATNIKTIGEARVEIIEKAKIASSQEEKERIADIVDYLLLEALYDTPRYSLISMGQTDRLGCYCPINSLLRSTIQAISAGFDVIVIDAEAGIEQVNRQVVESVDYPVIVTDNSVRGVNTAFMIHELIERIPSMKPLRTGVIFNRVADAAPALVDRINSSPMRYYGSVGPDLTVTDMDARGDSLFRIQDNSSSLREVRGILSNGGLL